MKAIVKFIKEAIQELRKVTWPARTSVVKMTIGVIVISAAFALFIGLVDFGLSKGIEQLVLVIAAKKQSQQQDVTATPIDINANDIQVNTTPAQ